jgi:hypothetical protein
VELGFNSVQGPSQGPPAKAVCAASISPPHSFVPTLSLSLPPLGLVFTVTWPSLTPASGPDPPHLAEGPS